MRLLPRSLAGRLLVTAGAAITVALVIASFAIGHVLGRFVTEGLDDRLDAQLEVVARAVRPDGGIERARAVDVPPFDRPGSGWAWQVTAPGGTLRSGSLAGGSIVAVRMPPPRPHDRPGPRPFEGDGPDGHAVHGRTLSVATAAGPAELVAAGPRWVVERPLRAALAPLLLSVASLGVALALAFLVQLRLGLRPVARLQSMLAEVREGSRRHVEVDEPTELLPLVAEMNALIDANEAGLVAARLHVANLAHALKTPLATLRLDVAEPGRDPDGRLAAQVARLEAQVRHHLSRARAADIGGRAGAAMLAPVIEGLVVAMRRLQADRALVADVSVPADLALRVDPHDLDEALGNLLDNAWRHARGRVTIAAHRHSRHAHIRIEDDGARLPDSRLTELRAGAVRVDEQAGGYGQGLRIARELIELHGGTIGFDHGGAGGLRVDLVLPAGTA